MATSETGKGKEVAQNQTSLTDARGYLIRRFSAPNGVIDEERGVQPFYLKSIHDFYKDYHSNWSPDKARLLEFGGGPCIYPLISAAPYVSEIVFAEYAKEGRKEVELWKNDDQSAHDWTPYFRHIVKGLEKSDEREVVKRQNTLRSKLSDIISCDLTLSYPLQKKLPLFDVISVNFCVEVVATDVKELTQYIRALGSLLKLDGFMGFFVSLEESFYVNHGTRYNHLFLTSENVRRAFIESGFEVMRVRHLDNPLKAQATTLNDCKALEHFVVKKIAET